MSSSRSSSRRETKVMVQPINLIFRLLQSKARVQIWLYENVKTRIEGNIIGFDEYMNLVLDDCETICLLTNTRNLLGRTILKGENITLMTKCPEPAAASDSDGK